MSAPPEKGAGVAGGQKSDSAYAPTARWAVTRSRRHVVCIVAARSVQQKVNNAIICGRVVGHVRGAAHYYSPFRVRDCIADHGARGDYPGLGPRNVVAGYELIGVNPDENSDRGITPHNSPGSNPEGRGVRHV